MKSSFRHELKYFISFRDYEILKRKLIHILKIDDFVGEDNSYHIRSLYFDNYKNSALFEKQSGILQRHKYRLRIYNLKKDLIKLEMKERVGQFIKKRTSILTYKQSIEILKGNYSSLKESDDSLQRRFYIDIVSQAFKPRVIVDYVREPYIYRYGNIRITFDKYLRTGLFKTSLFDKHIKMVDVIEEPKLIMEVKYDDFMPALIRDIIRPDASTRYAISKYVICRKFTKLSQWEDN